MRTFKSRTGSATVAGFTLVELMVVLTIAAILAAVSYPMYTEHLLRSRRNDAQTVLMEAAHYMQRHYASHNTFKGAVLPPAYAVAPKGAASGTQNYTLSLDLATTQEDEYAFKLVATPRLPDDACGDLSWDHRGQKGESGSKDLAYCWR